MAHRAVSSLKDLHKARMYGYLNQKAIHQINFVISYAAPDQRSPGGIIATTAGSSSSSSTISITSSRAGGQIYPLASSKLFLVVPERPVPPPRSLIANRKGSSSSNRLSGREKLDRPPRRSHVPDPALPGRFSIVPGPTPKLEVDP